MAYEVMFDIYMWGGYPKAMQHIMETPYCLILIDEDGRCQNNK